MTPATRQRLRLYGGTELSFITAGDPSKPAMLLLHEFPSSAREFRDVISDLSQAIYVIAPDFQAMAGPTFCRQLRLKHSAMRFPNSWITSR